MAKKPGLMNPLQIANLMASAAHSKVNNAPRGKGSTKGKSFEEPGEPDDHEDAGPPAAENPGKGGAKHPTAPKSVTAKVDGKMSDDLSGDAVSTRPGKVSGKQIAAMKYKDE